jgi:membrane protein YqaA with SNARE-associated domain
MSDKEPPLDRLARGNAAQFFAFAWGFAEATLFFIVPDVLLTVIGCRSVRASLKACGFAILGALLGGLVMYSAGRAAPDNSRAVLTRVPAIHRPLIERVQLQLSERGLAALMLGPATGTPYKIYAVEWGVQHGGLPLFLLVSIPARGIRFLLLALLANGIARLLTPWTRHNARIEMTVLGILWAGFYALYFVRFGW